MILRWREERGGLKNETIGGVLCCFEQVSLPFIHLSMPLAALIGVVSTVCFCVDVCVGWLFISIYCVRLSRPGGSYMKEPVEALWRTSGTLTQCFRFRTHATTTHATHSLAHSVTRSCRHTTSTTHNPQIPILAHPCWPGLISYVVGTLLCPGAPNGSRS